jgi:3-dehydroquinate synthetase
VEAGLLGKPDLAAIVDAIRGVGPLPRTDDLAISGIISAMKRDKKAAAGRIVLVLPERIGSVVIKSDVPPRIINRALKDSLSRRIA